jgi:CHAT domain-containing protein
MLWHLLVEQIAWSLKGAVPDGTLVTIVPDGALSFLPCHAASLRGDGVGGLLDRYPVAYSPSVYALRASQHRDTPLDRALDVLAVVDPSGDLDFARDEGTFLTDVAPRHRVLHGSDATLRQVTAAIAGRSHLHFACHGSYDPDDAVRSGLRLADGTLTVAGILDPALDLGGTRLVTLSACETGLIDTRYAADEFIGLPTAFQQAGARGVISTLWPVQDRATSLLIRRFYEHHLSERLAPAEALRAAQRWLRDVTGAELDDGSPPTGRPYGDPYYWAAFQLTGT